MSLNIEPIRVLLFMQSFILLGNTFSDLYLNLPPPTPALFLPQRLVILLIIWNLSFNLLHQNIDPQWVQEPGQFLILV